ncbi:MAG TPA: hypothetical protein G4N94_00145 [Caldilineae bacterium]|nr:hypothetical protein [Caldilineae bacterium]
MSPRLTRLILLAIILLAFALRLYEIDAQSFWYDEGVTAQVARLGVRELARWTADDIQPPLYYLLVDGWLRLNPFGEGILRWPSAAFGTLLIPLLWALGRRLWDDRAGLLAALVGATSPLMVYYGQEARMYALLVTLVTLAALVVVRLLDRGAEKRWGLLLAYALAGLAAMYTHYFAGFALLALALYWGTVWWRTGRERRRLGEFALVNAVILLGYLPWLPAMFNRFAVDSSYWSGTLKLGEALLDVVMNFTVGATEVMLEGDARAWLPWFGLAALAWLVAIAVGYRRGDHRNAQRPLALLLLWGLLPTFLILSLAFRTPKFNARYLMVSWPAWALLAGGGVANLWSVTRRSSGASRFTVYALRMLAILSVFLLLLAHAQGLSNWFNDDNFAKSAWREAIMEMYAHRQDDETVLLVSGHAYPVFDTYIPPRFGVERQRLPELEILDVNQVLGWEETARALNQYLAGKGGVWLFLWQDEVVDPTNVTVTLLARYADPQPAPDYAYLDLRHYRLRPGQSFPEQPPTNGPQVDFGGQLRLVGIERGEGGLWLYWRALQPDLPDIQIAMTITDEAGETLFEQDARPAGYDFPTTRWQVGETYPAWLPLDAADQALRIRLLAYDAATGERIAEQTVELAP